MSETIEPWDLIPQPRRDELVRAERDRVGPTHSRGYWHDYSVPHDMEMTDAEKRVRARVNREGVEVRRAP